MKLSPRQKMSAGRLLVGKKFPYFSTAMRALIPIELPGLKTLGVSEDGRLFYDPAFVEEHSTDDLSMVLAHELLHVLRCHAKQSRIAGIPADAKLARLANIAMDCEINDDLIESGFTLVEGGVTAGKYGMEDGKVWQEYFAELRKQANDPQTPEAQELADMMSGEGEGEGGRGPMNPAGGDCGSCAGNKHPDEPDHDGDASSDDPASVPGRTERDLNRIRKDAARRVVEAAKGRGNVPAGFRRWADEYIKPAKIAWQTLLARALRQATSWVSGATDYRYGRRSRRQGVIGFGPGKMILPRMERPVPNVWCVLDTSGSMGDKEISDAVDEIGGIVTAQRGANVTFLSGDAEVHDIVKARTIGDVKSNISGGGGTDFRPPFALAERAKKWDRPNIIVYCTDGMGPAPASPPKGIRTIWVLVGPHRTPPAPWGECIDLELDGANVDNSGADASSWW